MNFDNRWYAVCIDCESTFRRTLPPGPHMDVCPDCCRRWEEHGDIVGEALKTLPKNHSFADLEEACAEIRARNRTSKRQATVLEFPSGRPRQ